MGGLYIRILGCFCQHGLIRVIIHLYNKHTLESDEGAVNNYAKTSNHTGTRGTKMCAHPTKNAAFPVNKSKSEHHSRIFKNVCWTLTHKNVLFLEYTFFCLVTFLLINIKNNIWSDSLRYIIKGIFLDSLNKLRASAKSSLFFFSVYSLSKYSWFSTLC